MKLPCIKQPVMEEREHELPKHPWQRWEGGKKFIKKCAFLFPHYFYAENGSTEAE